MCVDNNYGIGFTYNVCSKDNSGGEMVEERRRHVAIQSLQRRPMKPFQKSPSSTLTGRTSSGGGGRSKFAGWALEQDHRGKLRRDDLSICGLIDLLWLIELMNAVELRWCCIGFLELCFELVVVAAGIP